MDSFARNSALRFCSWFLALSLLATAGLASLYFTVLQPNTTKTIIADSGAYESMSKAAINAVVAQKDTSNLVPLNSPEVKNILGTVFTPSDLQKTTEEFIDKAYAWLNGDTKELPLALGVNNSRQSFINKTGEYLQTRLSSLPPCTTRAQIAANTDPFVSSCLPPGTDITAQRTALEQQLAANTSIPSELSVDEATTGKIDTANSKLDTASKLPEQYQKLKRLFFIMLAVSLALAVGVVIASQNFISGAGALGKLFLKTGVIIAILGLVLMMLLPHVVNGVDLKTSQAADTVILPLLKSVVQAFGKVYLLFGVITAALGGIFIILQKRYYN